MAEFSNLGNNTGMVYVTKPDGTTILKNIPNNSANVELIKVLALKAAPLGANLIAWGSVQFTAVSGANNVTGINVNGVNQMSGNESVSGLTIAQTATAVASNINGHTPASGTDYTATAIDDTVYIYATEDAGSTVNGHVVAMVTDDAANITSTDTDMSGGANSNTVYDEAHGYRFFLNDASTATQGDLTGATEITNKLIVKGLQSGATTQSVTISNDSIAPTRDGRITILEADTEGSAGTDALKTINPKEFTTGDVLIIRGADSGRVITLDETDNIDLAGGTTFATSGYETAIQLQLFKKGGAANDLWYWFEVSRSTQKVSSVASFRTSSFPFTSQEGEASIAIAASGTVTLTANTDKVYQNITGTKTLTGNYNITCSATGAVAGDKFILDYQGLVTIGSYSLKLQNETLTATQALKGGLIVMCYYDGSAWNSYLLPNLNAGYEIEAANINNATITLNKLETNAQKDHFEMPVSFESGEIGDNKIEVPFPCTVDKIIGYVTKLVEATDDANVLVKDNSGSTMSDIDISAGSTIGTKFTHSPTTNNTFTANQTLIVTPTKVTAGGKIFMSIHITKT